MLLFFLFFSFLFFVCFFNFSLRQSCTQLQLRAEQCCQSRAAGGQLHAVSIQAYKQTCTCVHVYVCVCMCFACIQMPAMRDFHALLRVFAFSLARFLLYFVSCDCFIAILLSCYCCCFCLVLCFIAETGPQLNYIISQFAFDSTPGITTTALAICWRLVAVEVAS